MCFLFLEEIAPALLVNSKWLAPVDMVRPHGLHSDITPHVTGTADPPRPRPCN